MSAAWVGRIRARSSSGVLAAVIWLGCFLAAVATGERIDVSILRTEWQVLPLGPLRAHPLQSVWHLHIQPPLWNLFIGTVDRWSPLGLAGSFYLLMAVSGSVLAWSVAELARLLGAGRRAAVVLSLVATLNTAVFLNAFAARYELPVAALLALLTVLSVRSGLRLAVPALAAAVVLTRSLFHPLWWLAIVAAWWLLQRRALPWKRVAVAAGVPLLMIGVWMVKTDAQVGQFTMSSWTGMNLLRSVQPAVPPATLQRRVDDGTISSVGAIPTFSPYDAYVDAVPTCAPLSDLAVLADPDRGTTVSFAGGDPVVVPNYNFECYPAVYDQAGSDALALIRSEPRIWMKARVWSVNNWFGVPAVGERADSPVTATLGALTPFALLAAPHPGLPDSWRESAVWVHEYPLSLVLLAGTLLVLCAGVRALWRRRGATEPASPAAVVVVLSAITVGWSAVAGIVGELGEQDRFRAMTDPLVIGVAGALAWTWWRRRPRTTPQVTRTQTVGLSAVVLLLGIGVVLLRDGHVADVIEARPDGATLSVPVITTPTTATSASTPAALPVCHTVLHLGDSNLGLAAELFRTAYAERGIDAVVDHANGRGAFTARDGGSTALDAIAEFQDTVPPDGRCWVIALSSADAVAAATEGTDPRVPIEAMADALGDEPVIWVTPVLASADTEWNLAASTAYDQALVEVAAGRPNLTVLNWQDIALDHLDQFQPDGVHYTMELYGLLVDTVLAEMDRTWQVGG